MSLHQIPITKANKRLIEIDSSEAAMSAETYNAIFEIGLKHVLNLGMTGLKQGDFPTLAAYEDAAFEIGQKNVEKVKAGKVTGVKRAAKGGKTSTLMTEMLRLAKIHAKSQYKALGGSVSKVSAADWTVAAKAYIDADHAAWQAQAEASLLAQTAPKTAAVDLGFIKEDPKKAAASAKAAAEKKAKAAAKAKPTVVTKAKPKAKPSAHA